MTVDQPSRPRSRVLPVQEIPADARDARPVSAPADPSSANSSGPSGAFSRFWCAALIAGLGEGIRLGAMPLLAAQLTHAPLPVAGVWAAGGLPFLLVGPVTGVLVDRLRDRRKALYRCDAGTALVMAAFVVLVATHSAAIATLMITNFLLGSIQTLRDNTALTVLPRIVAPERLDAANARVQSVQLLTIDLLGPPLGVVLFALPTALLFGLDALSSATAAVLVAGVAVPLIARITGRADPGVVAEPDGVDVAPVRQTVRSDLATGFKWLRAHPPIRSLCTLVGLSGAAVSCVMSVAVLYASQTLHVGRLTYAVLLGVIALGAVIGALAASRIGRTIGRGWALRAAFALGPPALLIAALTSQAYLAAGVLTAVGAAVGLVNVISVSTRQTLVPENLLGRVNSAYRLVAVGSVPVGALFGGVLAEAFGLRAPFFAAALILTLGLVVAFRRIPGAGPDTQLGAATTRRVRRPLWRWARRAGLTVATLVTVLVLVAAGFVGWSFHRTLPTTNGTLSVAGLDAGVDIMRDPQGVPQIYADGPHDLFFAQGYVHAQDRFFEMDVRRNITSGRLAEMFGAAEVSTDKVVRTMGWRNVAEQEWTLLDSSTKAQLQAYADGVNAYLRGKSAAQLSAEYTILRVVAGSYQPELWSPIDSLAWLKAIAWDLRGNLSEETQRALLAESLPVAQVEQLYPGYDYKHERTLIDTALGVPAGAAPAGAAQAVWTSGDATMTPSSWTSGQAGAVAAAPALEAPAAGPAAPAAGPAGQPATGTPGLDALADVLGPGGPGIGSNGWVVSGAHTTTGKPLLANDPHLDPSQPGIWYQNGLHCRQVGPSCPYDVSGYSFTGMPAVVIGHNSDIAWGFTNLGADVTDLVLERVDGASYLYKGQEKPLVTRQEIIRVAGGKPITLTVRSTRHGPLLSDAMSDLRKVGAGAEVPGDTRPSGGYAVALEWTALRPRPSIEALFELDRATDWQQFRTAAAAFAVPAQNMLYADRAGHIGYQMPGAIPVRSAGDNGRYPEPGWTGTHEWTGTIPFDHLPSVFDPPSGLIVSSNNAIVGPRYPYLITTDWDDGLRSERITDLLEADLRRSGAISPADMAAIQLDTRNPLAAMLAPYLLRVPNAPVAQSLLRGWDGSQPIDSAAAAYFNAVWRHLLRLTFHDRLAATATGADPDPDGSGRWYEVVHKLLGDPTSVWWTDPADPRHLVGRDAVLRAAMSDASAELTKRLGDNQAKWRWGDLHTLTLVNTTLGTGAPAPIRWLLNQAPVQVPGGSDAVNATSWDARDGYAVNFAPSMRMVVDLSDLDASRWVNQTGASGHAFDAHYKDQTPAWSTGTSYAWAFSAPAVKQKERDRLHLRPAAGAANGTRVSGR